MLAQAYTATSKRVGSQHISADPWPGTSCSISAESDVVPARRRFLDCRQGYCPAVPGPAHCTWGWVRVARPWSRVAAPFCHVAFFLNPPLLDLSIRKILIWIHWQLAENDDDHDKTICVCTQVHTYIGTPAHTHRYTRKATRVDTHTGTRTHNQEQHFPGQRLVAWNPDTATHGGWAYVLFPGSVLWLRELKHTASHGTGDLTAEPLTPTNPL